MSDEDSRYLKQPRRITHPTSAPEMFLSRGLRTILEEVQWQVLLSDFDIFVQQSSLIVLSIELRTEITRSRTGSIGRITEHSC
jgi:hypothetical protein